MQACHVHLSKDIGGCPCARHSVVTMKNRRKRGKERWEGREMKGKALRARLGLIGIPKCMRYNSKLSATQTHDAHKTGANMALINIIQQNEIQTTGLAIGADRKTQPQKYPMPKPNTIYKDPPKTKLIELDCSCATQIKPTTNHMSNTG